ncbi:hypothetical protein AB1Y20_007507 [Prymnesium parvum]|uniref:Cytochrome b-c1 complex subunit 8 n=1 Tax=Prymnesium parvum TaxID=97485 RepID=A0AB34IV84_PRYPA
MRGVRVYSWSQFESKAFGGFWYETKKKVVGHVSAFTSAWYSLWPPVIGGYALVKWAENKYHEEQLHHRD